MEPEGDGGIGERGGLDAEAMELEVWPDVLDGRDDAGDSGGVSLAAWRFPQLLQRRTWVAYSRTGRCPWPRVYAAKGAGPGSASTAAQSTPPERGCAGVQEPVIRVEVGAAVYQGVDGDHGVGDVLGHGGVVDAGVDMPA